MTPAQFSAYLARLRRNKTSERSMSGLPIVCVPKAPDRKSPLVQKLLSVTEADAVRGPSGPEYLRLQGFPSDWMRAITSKHKRPAMQSCPTSLKWVARHLIAHMRGAGVGFVDARQLTSVRLGVL